MAFLDPFQDPTFMDSAAAFQSTPAPGPVEGLQAAMTQPATDSIKGPRDGFAGFLQGMTQPDESGVTFADKIFAAGSVLSKDADPLSAITAKRTKYTENQAALAKEAKLAQERAKKAAALKAAYVNGKFNPQAYIEAMGNEASLDDLTGATRLAPKGGVDGGYAYTTDPFTGETTFGGQRPISRAEQLAQERFDEQERRNQVLEDIARGRLGVAQGQLGVSRDRLNRPSGGGAAPQPAQPSAPRISNPAQLQALPPGSLYVAPDGTTRRKR